MKKKKQNDQHVKEHGNLILSMLKLNYYQKVDRIKTLFIFREILLCHPVSVQFVLVLAA